MSFALSRYHVIATWIVRAAAAVSIVGASSGYAQDAGTVANVRDLRLRGALPQARALAESELGQTGGDARREIALRLELARVYDRIGLHQNTRPVADALAQIEASSSAALRAGLAPLPEIELALAGYYYRAEMAEREFTIADKHVRRAIELFRDNDDGHGEADAIHTLGLIHLQRGELDRARALFDESWQLDRAAGERDAFRGDYERHAGYIHMLNDDTPSSIRFFTRSLHFRREAGAIDASLFAARILSSALVEIGQTDKAKPHVLYALAIAEHMDSPVGKARSYVVLARILAHQGDSHGAGDAYEASIQSAESVGYTSYADDAREELEAIDAPATPPDTADTKGAIGDAVAAFGHAFASADIITLRSLLTSDYVHVNGGSGTVLDHDQWLSWVTSRRSDLDRGTLVIDTYHIRDVHIAVFGDVAVVKGTALSSGTRDGKPFNTRIAFTNTWTKSGDSWRRAVFVDWPAEN